MSETTDETCERIADKAVSEIANHFDWLDEKMGAKPDKRSAREILLHAASLICAEKVKATGAVEILDDLTGYPVAATYPDGPCLKREDMVAVKSALTSIRALQKGPTA